MSPNASIRVCRQLRHLKFVLALVGGVISLDGVSDNLSPLVETFDPLALKFNKALQRGREGEI